MVSERHLRLLKCSIFYKLLITEESWASLILNSHLIFQDNDGKQISIEVAVMLKLAADSDGTSPHIRMLDWYKLDKELILVLERPMPAVDFYNYLRRKGGFLREEAAKVSCCDQLRVTAVRTCQTVRL